MPKCTVHGVWFIRAWSKTITDVCNAVDMRIFLAQFTIILR